VERNYLNDLGVNGEIIIEWLAASEVDRSGSERGQVLGSCESVNERDGDS